MATVTGMTAAAMDAIRNGAIVGADFDSTNNLILTKYDGTQINAGTLGAATTSLTGPVELATSAETQAGLDATRAVTPAGLASLPGTRVQILSTPLLETDLQAAYPTGVSMMDTSTWSLNGGYGTVVTHNVSQWRCQQTFYSASGGTSYPRAWIRHYNTSDGGGGWTGWRELSIIHPLTAANYSQVTAFTSYPQGWSRLYYTTATSGAWDFSGWAGEVRTYVDGADFAKQIFIRHSALTNPEEWIRTANSSNGWSTWRKHLDDPGAWASYTPAWTTSSGANTPSLGNATVDCRSFKIGRRAEVRFEITFGSTTNFGGGGTGDNWDFSLPYTAARTTDSIGWLQIQQSNDKVMIGRARLVSATTFRTSLSSGFADGTAITNTGDMDALSPFTWASGNSIKGHLSFETAS